MVHQKKETNIYLMREKTINDLIVCDERERHLMALMK